MKILLGIALSFILCGCTTHVVSSNPRSVLVESAWLNAKEAQRLADAECAKHGRYAKMTLKADYTEQTYSFDCVD